MLLFLVQTFAYAANGTVQYGSKWTCTLPVNVVITGQKTWTAPVTMHSDATESNPAIRLKTKGESSAGAGGNFYYNVDAGTGDVDTVKVDVGYRYTKHNGSIVQGHSYTYYAIQAYSQQVETDVTSYLRLTY